MKRISDDFIDLIYCDILYGTGNKYDEYADLKVDRKNIKEFYLPRFEEMHRILKQTGSVYIQCDWRINHWIRIILDEIFGYKNFRNEIIWCYAGGGIPNNDFPRKHDVILRYSKNDNYFYQPIYREYSEGTKQRGRTAVKGKYAKIGLRKEGTPVNDWWYDVPKITSPTDPEKLGYPTQKPEALLERIIKASSNECDLVADFFCGSGTTLAVAKKLGRNFIGCDINKEAVKITKERLDKIDKQRPFGF